MAEISSGQVLGNKYRIDSLIEQTRFGRLYRGVNTSVDRNVIIQIVAAEFHNLKQDLFGKARKISRISHPALLAVTDLGDEQDGTPFVVYESFDGDSLASRLV